MADTVGRRAAQVDGAGDEGGQLNGTGGERGGGTPILTSQLGVNKEATLGK